MKKIIISILIGVIICLLIFNRKFIHAASLGDFFVGYSENISRAS